VDLRRLPAFFPRRRLPPELLEPADSGFESASQIRSKSVLPLRRRLLPERLLRLELRRLRVLPAEASARRSSRRPHLAKIPVLRVVRPRDTARVERRDRRLLLRAVRRELERVERDELRRDELRLAPARLRRAGRPVALRTEELTARRTRRRLAFFRLVFLPARLRALLRVVSKAPAAAEPVAAFRATSVSLRAWAVVSFLPRVCRAIL
jgi:hypothetical protein